MLSPGLIDANSRPRPFRPARFRHRPRLQQFGQRTDLETSRKVIHKGIDLGITLFDTADIYAGMGGSETVLGTVLGDRRKDIVLATKYSKPMSNDGTRRALRAATSCPPSRPA